MPRAVKVKAITRSSEWSPAACIHGTLPHAFSPNDASRVVEQAIERKEDFDAFAGSFIHQSTIGILC